jgi:hypothetical protein
MSRSLSPHLDFSTGGANADLLDNLMRRWSEGTAGMPRYIWKRGMEAFQAFTTYPDKINVVSNENPNGVCVQILGKALRNGTPPSLDLLLRDVEDGISGCRFMSLKTCSVETNVSKEDYLQQDKLLEAGDFTVDGLRSRILVGIDIPSTKHGLGRCEFVPYDHKTHHAHGVWASTRTPPGNVTLIHIDGYGSRIYAIHWRGDKLWVFWPATEKNLKIVRGFKKDTLNEREINEIWTQLERPEMMLLTEDEYREVQFELRTSVAHACFSFSDSAHSGITRYVYHDLGEAKRLFNFADEAGRSDCLQGGAPLEIKESIISDLKGDLEGWRSIAGSFKGPKGRRKKTEITDMLKGCEDMIKDFERMLA